MYFSGVYTALVTPFAADGSVDFEKLAELVEFNIAGGVAGLVPVGDDRRITDVNDEGTSGSDPCRDGKGGGTREDSGRYRR